MQVAADPFVPPPQQGAALTRTETAHEWFLRSQRARAAHHTAPPKDPSAAAWAFCRPPSSSSSSTSHYQGGGTGISFVDAALRRDTHSLVQQHHQQQQSLPVVDLRGASDTGKTWTVLSLAARFAVATRPSQFASHQQQAWSNILGQGDDSLFQPPPLLPQVLVLDSQYNVTLPKLVYAVRSMLLRRMSSDSAGGTTMTQLQQEHDEEELQDKEVQFQGDMEDCLRRIQIVHSSQGDSLSGFVPILEMMRHQLAQTAADHPTLILWDGFLSEPDSANEGARMEVIRQLERLLLDCSVLLITTTTTAAHDAQHARTSSHRREWERFITQRIRLDRNSTTTSTTGGQSSSTISNNSHEYLATVHGAQIPFSISMAGILS